MRTSLDGMLAILADEAIVLSSYKDGGGVLTIGVGHTANAGQPRPQPGLKLTLRQALQLFVQDLRKFELGVMKAFTTPLKQHEFDGFVSFHFNTGKAEKGSVDDKWDAGDKAAAIKTLKAYRKDNGKIIAGLKMRRAREADIIDHGIYPAVKNVRVADGWKGAKPINERRVPADEIRAVLREILQPAKTVEFDAPAPKSEMPPAEAPHDGNPGKPEGEPVGGAGKAIAGGVSGGIAAGGAIAAGVDWKLVAMIAGCAVALVAIIWLVSKIRRQQ